jgi:hypothetical protein
VNFMFGCCSLDSASVWSMFRYVDDILMIYDQANTNIDHPYTKPEADAVHCSKQQQPDVVHT